MVPRKKISTPFFSFNAGNSVTLNGKKIGTNPGDIPTFNESGQININNLPIGKNKDQLITGNDKRLKYSISGSSFVSLSGQTFKIDKVDLANDTQGTIDLSQGGTGLTSYTKGDLSYYKENTTLTKLPIGSENQILSITNGLPAWQNSQATNYTKSGNLLQLSNNNFSIKEGTLTNAKLCTYDTTAGLVCNTEPASGGVETDPIFTAWNKSTGISITESQISDLKTYLTSYTETDPTISAWAKNATKPTYSATEIGLGNVPNLTFSGSNTGDQDLTGLVHTNRIALDLISNTNTGDETNSTIKTKLGSATTTLDGYLTTTDWNIFNSKQPAGAYLTSYTETDSRLPIAGTSGNLLKSDGSVWTSWTPNFLTTYSETDPIFTAWNRSTGLTVTESQISDLKTYLTVETDPIWTANKTSYSTKTVADGLYLGITAKATDSDTLDNHDTSYFQTNLGFTPYNATNPNNYLSTIDISTNTNLAVSGTLLNLTGDTLSIKEGTLTNTKLCTYDTTAGLVCDTSTSSVGHTPATINATPNGLSIDGSQIISLALASTNTTGALNSTDWNIFNNKQPAGAYLTGTKADSFNTRTGAITLSGSDVTTALTFTPYNATNPNNYISTYSETDPIFTAWNKSTGISITESQISDLKTYLTSYSETDPTISAWAKNATKPTYSATEIGLGNVPNLTFSGSNTGDETQTTIKTKLGSATTTLDGYLTTTDWNIFNNKQPAGAYLTSYTETDPTYNASQAKNITAGHITILGNTSNTNSGDNATNSQYSSLATSKQNALSGTGFVKISSTTISYDNSTYLTGTKVDSFNTRTGAITLSSSDVTTALTFTPYNSTNPSNYITTSSLHNSVTLGTSANGLTLSTQELSLGLSSTTTIGALSNTDWNTFSGKQNNLGFTPYNATNPNSYVSFATILTVDGTGSGLDADKLDGFDSSAFGDATAANQATILARIGTNADAASMATTLFAGQQYIWDNRKKFGKAGVTDMSANPGGSYTYAGAASYCYTLSSVAQYAMDGDTTTVYDDWHLPNVNEAGLFVGTVNDSNLIWTATVRDANILTWIYLRLSDGYWSYTNYSDSIYVRCVR